MTPQEKNLIIDRLVSNEDLDANQRALEILEGYEKLSDIISRTHTAMGRSKQIKVTTASTDSDKILAYVTPSTH